MEDVINTGYGAVIAALLLLANEFRPISDDCDVLKASGLEIFVVFFVDMFNWVEVFGHGGADGANASSKGFFPRHDRRVSTLPYLSARIFLEFL